MSKPTNAISPTRKENYPEWYQQVIRAADLSESSVVRGCMVIKPWGYAIWENMKSKLDKMFKDTGHVNAYFPLFIPLSFLEKEAEHVDGFAKECAVVTHHRLEADGEGGLKPAGKLEEPLVVRPTSEMIIGSSYSKWVQSYRDLPLLINQWANVVRWEMRTRQFLRTSEFLWQEGHTAHAKRAEAEDETMKMLRVYEDFAKNDMAMPVICGEKAAHERFPGAENTYCIEAMMQDGKAIQAGTSHFLGQKFAKAMDISFQDENGEDQFAWTTSWGVTTRLVGGLIMTHSDDDGLILPPKLAPKHICILPILKKNKDNQAVIDFCHQLKKDLESLSYEKQELRVELDLRELRGGEKTWQYIKKGVPIRIEVGARDVEAGHVMVARRDQGPKEKSSVVVADLLSGVVDTLGNIQSNLYQRAVDFQEKNTHQIESLEDFQEFFKGKDSTGFVKAHWSEGAEIESILKPLKVTHRCIPLDDPEESGVCIFSGKPSVKRSIFARAY
ncbi:MAG: proline--tRNA ligase [Oligoflexales bacterium]